MNTLYLNIDMGINHRIRICCLTVSKSDHGILQGREVGFERIKGIGEFEYHLFFMVQYVQDPIFHERGLEMKFFDAVLHGVLQELERVYEMALESDQR